MYYIIMFIQKSKAYAGLSICALCTWILGGIPVYVYKPKPVDPESYGVPIVVYFHGGGGIMGSRNRVDSACKILSK